MKHEALEYTISAIGYTRFSSTQQREASNTQQRDIITKYASDNNIKLLRFYEDSACSGANDRRKGFQNMVNSISNGDIKVNYVIILQMDRFSRNFEDAIKYISILKKNNVEILCVSEPNGDSPEAELNRGLQMLLAQYGNKKLGRETLRGLKYNATRCLSTGGIANIGYKWNNEKKLEIDPYESQIVKLIFRLYADGKSYQEILKELELKQYRTKNKNKFSKNSLYEILRNEKYNGVNVYNKRASKGSNGKRNNSKHKPENQIIKVKDGVPKIIDDKTFAKVQQRLKNNKKRSGSYSSTHNYLLSFKVFCECGFRMSGNCNTKPGRPDYLSYICNSKKNKYDCDNRSIGGKKLEEFVITQLVTYIYRNKDVSSWTTGLNKYIAKQLPTNALKIQENNKGVKSLDKKIENILSSIEDGVSSEDFVDRLNEIKFNKQELIDENERLTKQDEESTEITETEVKEGFSKMKSYLINNPIEARKLIDQYVKKVIVHKEEIEVIMKSTINLSDKYDPKLNKEDTNVA